MELQKLLQDEIREGLYRITISGPRGDSEVSKVRIRPVEIKGKLLFQCQETVGTKEFHKNMTKDDVITRISDWMNGTFKQMQLESDTCTASVLVSKKGTMTIKKKPHMKGTGKPVNLAHNRKKRYILEEGIPVPFLQDLGVMTKEGKIVRTRYDKFRQINRFLEFIEDILPQLPSDREITILDFGCGKSYLTFAMYYYFRELKKLDVNCVLAESAEKALEILQQGWQFDIILTDLWMPGLSGSAFADLLKRNEQTAGIPVVAVTADTQITSEDAQKFRQVLTKPITRQALIDAFRANGLNI